MLRKIARITFPALFLAALWPWGAACFARHALAAAAAQEQVKHLEKALEKEKEKYRTLHRRERGLLEEISHLEKVVEEKRRGLVDLKQRVTRLVQKQQKMERRLRTLQQSLEETEMRLGEQAVILYKFLRLKYMRVLATASDLDHFRKRMKYLQMLIEEDVSKMDVLLAEKLRRQGEVEKMREAVAAVRGEEEKARARVKRLREELESDVFRLVNVRKEKKFYETAVRELEAGAKALRRTLKTLEGVAPPPAKPGVIHFAKWKGRLAYPMPGKAVTGARFLRKAAGHFGKGILIVGGHDAAVRAVAPGRVDFSGKVKGYGTVAILNHGDRYFTLYGNLVQVDKKKGEEVAAGEVLGRPGRDTGSRRHWIYFEIRKGGKSLSPMKWFRKGQG